MGLLEGRIALVTGGARGIGLAIVERFIVQGARVLIADIDDAGGRALAHAHPGRAVYRRLDVTVDEDWRAALDHVGSSMGSLTTMVNNAGINFTGSIADQSEDDWRATMDINGLGTFLGCRHAVRAMAQHGGTIINIASANGQRASPSQIAYSASKALILNLTESVALHCGAHGLAIRCNAIAPGVVETPLLRKHIGEFSDENVARKQLGAMHPIGRIGQPEEVAAAAAFLASDESSFMTGSVVNVDGGYRIR